MTYCRGRAIMRSFLEREVWGQIGQCKLSKASYRCYQGGRSLLSIERDNLLFYPNFALFLTLGRMNLDHDFFQVSKLSEDQKKSLHQKWNTFLPEFWLRPQQKKGLHQQWNTCFPEFKKRPALRCTHQSQIIGGDADHTQIIRGMYPPIPPRFRHPWLRHFFESRCVAYMRNDPQWLGQLVTRFGETQRVPIPV